MLMPAVLAAARARSMISVPEAPFVESKGERALRALGAIDADHDASFTRQVRPPSR
jgi:hypothetical protein